MSYQTALFDLDGTLLDTIEDLKDAVNHELAAEGDPLRTLEEVTRFVGNGLRNLMLRALPAGRSEEEIDRRTASMKSWYSAHSQVKTRPYPGIVELLQDLREAGVAVGVVSNKADSVVKDLCESYFPGGVDAAVGEIAGLPRKPAPDTVELALQRMGRDKAGAVYIGDSEVDIATAKNAGLPCLSVTWGFRPKEVLEEAGATALIHTAAELWQAITGGD